MINEAKIQNELKSLSKCNVAALKAIYKRSHRVCDTRGMTKNHLITDIMFDRHGRKACKAALGW